MTIYDSPFPLNGIQSANKGVVEQILQHAENDDPGFCERNGIQLDNGRLPLGKIKHEAIIKKLWPTIPTDAKEEFLVGQYLGAINYLNGCLGAFEVAGVPIPAGLKMFKPKPFPGEEGAT